MKRIVWTGLLTLTLATAAWAADSALDPVVAALEAGKYDQVVELASAIDAKSPERARADYLIGEAELVRGNHAEAEAAFLNVLRANKDAVPALIGLGTTLSHKGESENAVKAFDRAAELAPKDFLVERARGEHHLRHDELKKAASAFSAASKLAPNDAQTCRGWVEALLRSDQQKSAKKQAKRFLKKNPEHPMGHFLAGLVADRMGDDDEAIEAYEQAIALDDGFLDAHKNLAIVCTARNELYQDWDRTKKALRHYERYFELGGKDEQLRQVYQTIDRVLSEVIDRQE